jgi:hypothetical protein
MDLRYHMSIIWRWRAILVAGLLLALSVSYLVTFKPGLGKPEWRSAATYTSTSRTAVTQPGFPWGRATLPGADPNQPVVPDGQRLRSFAPPQRFTDLAVVYAYLAQSDQVRDLISPRPFAEQINVATVPNPATGDPLPIIEIATTGTSAAGAQKLNRATIAALRQYLERNVRENEVPLEDRATLEVLNPPKPGFLVAGRSLSLSVIAGLLALALTFVAIYVLENLYPDSRPSLLLGGAPRGGRGGRGVLAGRNGLGGAPSGPRKVPSREEELWLPADKPTEARLARGTRGHVSSARGSDSEHVA